MRRIALLFVIIAFSGCVSEETTETITETKHAIGWLENTYIIDGGKTIATTHPSIKEIPGGFEIDTLASYGRDQASFWVLQAQENQMVTVTKDYEFSLVQEPLAEGGRPLNGCLQTGRLDHGSAQYMRERALGNMPLAVAEDNGGWSVNAASGGGTFSGSSLAEFNLDSNESFLMVMVYSQFAASDIESGHSKFSITSDGNLSVTVLPPAPWVCSFTFAPAWEGATYQKLGTTHFQEGGSLEVDLPYGGSVHACGQSPTGSVGTTTTENIATLALGDKRETIEDNIPFREETLEAAKAWVEVGRWTGTPFFEIRGMPWQLGGHAVNCN